MKMKNGFVAITIFYVLIVVAFSSAPLIMQGLSFYTINEPERAFFLGEDGIRYYIKSQLDGDDDWSDNTAVITKTFAGGSFTVTPSNQEQSRITLQSSGSVLSQGIDTFDRIVEYTLRRPGASAFSGEYLLYGGGGGGDGTGDLTFEHINNGDVDGSIYVAGDYDAEHAGDLTVTGEIQDQMGGAGIPEVDWAYWQSEADHTITGDHTFTGNSSTYTGVYYIDGDVTIDASNTVTFNGTIVATGSITFDNASSLVMHPAEGQPAVVAGVDLNVGQGNNIVFDGPIYAYDDVFIDQANNIEIYGPIVFGDTAFFDSTNNIYMEMWSSLVKEGFIGGLYTFPIPVFHLFC